MAFIVHGLAAEQASNCTTHLEKHMRERTHNYTHCCHMCMASSVNSAQHTLLLTKGWPHYYNVCIFTVTIVLHPSYPCLHIKYMCVIHCGPSIESSKHHCSVVVNFGEGVASQWRWYLSSGGLGWPLICRVSGKPVWIWLDQWSFLYGLWMAQYL